MVSCVDCMELKLDDVVSLAKLPNDAAFDEPKLSRLPSLPKLVKGVTSDELKRGKAEHKGFRSIASVFSDVGKAEDSGFKSIVLA